MLDREVVKWIRRPYAAWEVRAAFPADTQAPFKEDEWKITRRADQGVEWSELLMRAADLLFKQLKIFSRLYNIQIKCG